MRGKPYRVVLTPKPSGRRLSDAVHFRHWMVQLGRLIQVRYGRRARRALNPADWQHRWAAGAPASQALEIAIELGDVRFVNGRAEWPEGAPSVNNARWRREMPELFAKRRR